MSIVRESVTITLAGKPFELQNTLQVRKGLSVQLGGLRPLMQAVMDMDEWRMAQAIAIASGQPKKTDAVFESVFEEGAASTAQQLGDYFASLLDNGKADEGNATATE